MTSEPAAINKSHKISGVWLIPLLALVLGAYVVIHSLLTQGPEIEIAFATANGLVEGETRVKYRDVNVGMVEDVRLNPAFDGVIARVKMNVQAEPLLREDTRFWVVTAEVGLDNISGLDTILSGAYIQLAPGTSTEEVRHYVALEQPPLTPTGAPGLRLQLTSERASSVSTGDTVLYNGYRVGRVESMEFNPSERLVRYVIFIDAPYHELVNSSVRFWDVSGVSVSAGADGFKVETGSLDTVLLGGVAFGMPEGISEGDPVEHNTEFKLYTSFEAVVTNPFRYGSHYVVSFDHSIKGLLPGAPVEYRGIPVGRVERIMLKESVGNSAQDGLGGAGGPIPILIYLEPARLELPDQRKSLEALHESIKKGVSDGLRASMETGNLLTGAQFIGFDYYDNIEEANLGSSMGYPSIPTIDTGLGQLQQKVTAILDMISGLPLDETISNANAAIETLDKTLGQLETLLANQSTQQLPVELEKTMQELRETLDGLSPESSTSQNLASTLLRVNRTLANIEALTQTLASKPNALIIPSSANEDPVPEARK